MDIDEKLDKITAACDERKALNLVVLDVRDLTLIADYFVMCTGSSTVHIDAIVDNVVQTVKGIGEGRARVEGTASSGWVLIDCGDIMVNVFDAREREYYGLERLWGDAEERELASTSQEQ
ncbi:MAG: ribosome silencing factor [Clostridia bacterium]